MTTPAQTAGRLTARTVALPGEAPDLLAFAGDDGFLFEWSGTGLAGRGVALRLPADQVARALAAFTVDDQVGLPGCGPVAMGALPFDPRQAGSLVVPREILGRRADGSAWLTTVGGPVGTPVVVTPVVVTPVVVTPVVVTPPSPAPDAFELSACRPHDQWCSAVSQAVERIREGALHKVVLAREVVVEANRPIRPATVVGRLRDLYPSCALFSVDGFVGASPELLVSRHSAEVRSQPLAGTIPRSGDPVVDDRRAKELLASPKDRQEHQLVVDAVAVALGAYCRDLEVPEDPSIVPLRNVSHLGTLITGRLGDTSRSALDLALVLHPTPAVAGVPTAEALDCMLELEGLDRGLYAGPVGWIDWRGDGQWAIGIRSAQLDGRRARLMAGVGVVADSDPEEELAETQLKLQALLAAVVRP